MPLASLNSSALTLGQLAAHTGLDVLDHLEREVTVPVVAGLQAQGDLMVIPFDLLNPRTFTVSVTDGARWRDVPPAGIELLRSSAGGNPHSLVADPGACRWTTDVHDTTGLALGTLTTTATAYLIHPEHGATGIAPGRYLVRRQRERSGVVLGSPINRLIAD